MRAKSRNVPACRAVEMKRFDPAIRQPPFSGVADVRSDPASEPASGSVSAKAPIWSPARERRHEAGALLVGAERRGSAA